MEAKAWMQRKMIVVLGSLAITLLTVLPTLADTRKPVANPEPEYPAIARQLRITGVVRVELVISADGTIKSSKILGGHPVLVDAVQRAIVKWKYAPAASETTQEVDFKF